MGRGRARALRHFYDSSLPPHCLPANTRRCFGATISFTARNLTKRARFVTLKWVEEEKGFLVLFNILHCQDRGLFIYIVFVCYRVSCSFVSLPLHCDIVWILYRCGCSVSRRVSVRVYFTPKCCVGWCVGRGSFSAFATDFR